MDKKAIYNDNELLYLIKNNNEEAYLFLIEKYRGLIFKKIKMYNLDDEDGFQEGLICLSNAINKYNDKYNKTFNKFFEQILINRFIDLKHEQQVDYRVIIDTEYIDNCAYLKEDIHKLNDYNLDDIYSIIKYNLKDIENLVYIEYYIKKSKPKEISAQYNITIANVYHIISRIKRKIKKYVVK